MTMPEVRVVKMWYRCVLEDGTTWCATSNQRECVEQGALSEQPVHYQSMNVYQYDGAWAPWEPSEERLKEAQEYARLLDEEQEAEL